MHAKIYHFNIHGILFLYSLIFAVLSNFETQIHGADNSGAKPPQKAIELALKAGNLVDVSKYLDTPAKINKYYGFGWPLGLAVRYQHLDLVNYLLEKGGDPDESGSPSPLERAVELENQEIISLLLEKESTVTEYVISLAIAKNNLDVLEELIEHSDQPFGPNGAARTALIGIPSYEAAKLLMDLGADVNAIGDSGESALHFVSDIEIAKLLIDMGLNANARTERGNNPLHCYYEDTPGNLDILAYLIESGADVNAVNDNGETPLHAMIRYNHFDQVELLLMEGANVHTKDMHSDYPLHNAAWHGEDGIELAKLLISNGADINASNGRGWTPLDVVLEHEERPKMGEFLVTQGAKSNADEHFYEPLSFFEKNPHFEESLAIYGSLGLFVFAGCFGVYGVARLMFAKEEQRGKYLLMIFLSIIGCIVFYSFFKMIAEGLAS